MGSLLLQFEFFINKQIQDFNHKIHYKLILAIKMKLIELFHIYQELVNLYLSIIILILKLI